MQYREIISSGIHTKRINTRSERDVEFVGAFAALRKEAVGFACSHWSVRMKQLGNRWTGFHDAEKC